MISPVLATPESATSGSPVLLDATVKLFSVNCFWAFSLLVPGFSFATRVSPSIDELVVTLTDLLQPDEDSCFAPSESTCFALAALTLVTDTRLRYAIPNRRAWLICPSLPSESGMFFEMWGNPEES